MILITGGAGYIGAHVAKTVARHGYAPLVLDSLENGHREFVKWGPLIVGNLDDPVLLGKIFQEYPIKAVMHFAGYAYVGESVTDPSKYYRNNVVNTLNLLEGMHEAGINRFIFSSSCASYGIPHNIPITEDDPQHPINPYGYSKLVVEQMLQHFEAAYGLKYVSLRYFNAAGADSDGEIGELHDPETHLIPLALETAMGKRAALKIFGTDYKTPDGTCIRDYVHVSDLAEAHLLALKYLETGGVSNAFNLGNGVGFSVREVVSAVERVTGSVVRVEEEQQRAGDPPMLVGSAEKARTVLRWQPHHQRLDDIVAAAWNYHQVNVNKAGRSNG